MKMKHFGMLTISRTILAAREQRRIITQMMTSKSSPVPLLLRTFFEKMENPAEDPISDANNFKVVTKAREPLSTES